MRPKGEGSVYRNKKATGPKTKWRGEYRPLGIHITGTTQKEVADELRRRIKEAETGRQPRGRQKTVGDVFDLWLDVGMDGYRKGGKALSDGTKANHIWAINRLKAVDLDVGRLVDVKLSELRPSHVLEALEAICRYRVPKVKATATKPPRQARRAPKASSEVLGEEALKRIRSVFALALEEAIGRDWLDTNPARVAKIPGVAKPGGRRGYIKAEPARLLMKALAEHSEGAVLHLMLGAALRPEETYALSVDALDGNLLFVSRSVRRTLTPNTTGKGPRNFTGWKVSDEMKTKASRRTIELPADVVEVLQAHLKREAPRIQAARARKETPLMFAKPDNGIVDAKPINRLLKELCESLGVYASHDDGTERLPTVAELRHTAITHMADHPDATIDTVAGVSGHANERMVRDRYFHKDDKPPKTAAARLDWRK